MHDRKKLFELLKNNPEMSAKDIAKKLGFSVSKVYKIKQSSKSKKNNLLFSNFYLNNLRHFIVLLKMKSSFDVENEIFKNDTFNNEKLKEMDLSIDFSFITFGLSDIVIGVSSKDISEVKMFCNSLKCDFHHSLMGLDIIEIIKPFELPSDQNSLRYKV